MIGEDFNAQEITEEFINQIKGNTKFFETSAGKFVKNLATFGISTALGAALVGPTGLVAGFSLGLLETYWLDNLLKGKNPSMFIDDIKKELK